jgi:hypothetical protein
MTIVGDDILSRLAAQGLRRPLTEAERALARALEQIFASGEHDFAAVTQRLDEHGVAVPSGDRGPWTVALLEAELKMVNQSLDDAYAAATPIAAYR